MRMLSPALLADGRRALSWSDDHTLKLRDLERGELLHTLVGALERGNDIKLSTVGRAMRALMCIKARMARPTVSKRAEISKIFTRYTTIILTLS